MLNYHYLWKYICILFLIIAGFIYALPNLYGENPTIQIINHGDFDTKILNNIKNILKQNNISYISMISENNIITIRFINIDLQLYANKLIKSILNKNYITVLNITPSTPAWLRYISAKPMKLGFDLRGGIHFLIEVDMYNILKKMQDQKYTNIFENLNKDNIAYINIEKNQDCSINIYFNNIFSLEKALNYLKKIDNQILIKQHNKNVLSINLTDNYINKLKDMAIQQNVVVLRNRINQLGIAESLVQRQGSKYISVNLPGIQDIAYAKKILGTTATLEFRLVNNVINFNKLDGNIPPDSEFRKMQSGKSILVYKEIIMSGDHITDAVASLDEYNNPQVNISLDNSGGMIMSNFSQNHIGKLIATLFVEYIKNNTSNINNSMFIKQEQIINIATITTPLNNNFRITGIKNIKEANQFATLLRAGALFAPIKIIEEKIVGPTMGQQNINKGLNACLYSLIFCIVFMVIAYKKFGLISIIALIINLIFIISIISLLPNITLTMSGIAGIILTLAVAIDANILINERIKEEIRNGKSAYVAIYTGYKKALSSIIDANITTVIKMFILYIIGTDFIKGFAIISSIGIVTSMFTSIICTRAIINLIYSKNKLVKKISI
ncbi:MAG: protein translocase subunit SecD [Pantoea sp. Brub]|nr:protein translocase subunit SecD [Pantoea sp. Brub]